MNVEAVVEMRPGIGIDRFVAGFIRESKTKNHPWVSEYDRTAKAEPDQAREAERHLLAALREVAKIQLTLRYDASRKRLTLSKGAGRSNLAAWVTAGGAEFSLVPLLLEGSPGGWRSLTELGTGECYFDDVPVAKVSAFVALRGQMRTPPLECRRFLVAKLEVEDTLLDERDAHVRAEILATADPTMILNALVRGLAHVRSENAADAEHRQKHGGLRELLAETTLERLLQAVALDPALVIEMRLLLGPVYGETLLRLCDDLEEVLHDARAEPTP